MLSALEECESHIPFVTLPSSIVAKIKNLLRGASTYQVLAFELGPDLLLLSQQTTNDNNNNNNNNKMICERTVKKI